MSFTTTNEHVQNYYCYEQASEIRHQAESQGNNASVARQHKRETVH